MNEPEAWAFFDWYSALDITTKVFVPGNHSTAVEQGLIQAEEYPDVRFLIHDSMLCSGLKGISNYGMFTRGATQFINCSCCNLAGKLKNNGFVVEV